MDDDDDDTERGISHKFSTDNDERNELIINKLDETEQIVDISF